MKILYYSLLIATLLVSLGNSIPIPEEGEDVEELPIEDGTVITEAVDAELFQEDTTEAEAAVAAPAASSSSSTTASTTTTTTTTTTEAPPVETAIEILTSTLRTKSDKSLDLENIQLSPKLNSLYKRLSALNPDLLRSGVIKFRQLLATSKSRDDFLTKLWNDSENPDATEFEQFKSDLEDLAKFIAEKHPKVLSWFLSTIGAGRLGTVGEKLSFLEKFSEIDDDLSQYPVWNRYWTYWFRSTGDFITKHG